MAALLSTNLPIKPAGYLIRCILVFIPAGVPRGLGQGRKDLLNIDVCTARNFMEACSGGRRVVLGLYCGRELATFVEGSLLARSLGTLAESYPFGESRHSSVFSELDGWVQEVFLRILECFRTPCFTAFRPYTRISSQRQLKISSPRRLMG